MVFTQAIGAGLVLGGTAASMSAQRDRANSVKRALKRNQAALGRLGDRASTEGTFAQGQMGDLRGQLQQALAGDIQNFGTLTPATTQAEAGQRLGSARDQLAAMLRVPENFAAGGSGFAAQQRAAEMEAARAAPQTQVAQNRLARLLLAPQEARMQAQNDLLRARLGRQFGDVQADQQLRDVLLQRAVEMQAIQHQQDLAKAQRTGRTLGQIGQFATSVGGAMLGAPAGGGGGGFGVIQGDTTPALPQQNYLRI